MRETWTLGPLRHPPPLKLTHHHRLPYGGWVAPNIYFMGYAGIVRFGSLVIAGLSGIYDVKDYYKTMREKIPYTPNSIRSVYHVKQCDVQRLLLVKSQLDVIFTHDWPVNATADVKGDAIKRLIRDKPYFRGEIERGDLGSPVAGALQQKLKPKYWFAGHLHVKFATIIPWGAGGGESVAVAAAAESDPDAIDLDNDDDGPSALETSAAAALLPLAAFSPAEEALIQATRFLALDKILPGRDFMQILDIPSTNLEKPILSYDLEWLAIVKATHHVNANPIPANVDLLAAQTFVESKFAEIGYAIPENFVQTVSRDERGPPMVIRGNPQTDELYAMLELDHIGFTAPCQ